MSQPSQDLSPKGTPRSILGRSGVSVSRLCLGTMMFGGPTDAAASERIIRHARENGVDFIDTANVYTDGRSEEIVGRAIAGERDHWFLASKVGMPLSETMAPAAPSSADLPGGLSRRHVVGELERSLQRLGTDHLDLYYCHRHDPLTSWEDVVTTFGDLIRGGKIRYWGLSNVRAWHIAEIVHLCHAMGVPQPVALQPYYNAMNRQPEVEVLPAASACGLGVVPYSPIARGILSGKYLPDSDAPSDSRVGRGDPRVLGSEWRAESLAIAQQLKDHAASRGASLVAFAVAWVLNNRAVTATIAGPRTFEQWVSYFDALNYEWTAEDEALVDQLVPPGHPSTPGYTDPKYPVEGRFSTVGS